MPNQKESYNQILRSTSIFGGVQVFMILISIIRSKSVAIFLGPTGMGISGLLLSSTGFVTALTNFGIARSSVKNIAVASGEENKKKIAVTVSVLKRLVWLTGILGSIITLVFSSILSELAFGSKDYTLAFVWLSVTLLFNQISEGQSAILRGLRKLTYMAKSSLWGSILGLLLSLPLYYFFSVRGIVPAIIISSIISLLLTFFYCQKLDIEPIKITNNELRKEGTEILVLGSLLSLGSLAVLGESFLIRIFIRYIGNIEDVGFYNAGFALIGTYFAVFFTALTTDYYPRLVNVANDNLKAILLMNQQSEMSVLILSPFLAIFLIFINPIVVVLYSDKFLSINEMILWAALGIYFKAASYSIGVIFVSKGHVKKLFWNDFLSTLVMLIFNILGYKYFGLEGLGVSFLGSFIFTFLLTYYVVKSKYSFSYSKEFFKTFLVQLVIGICCLSISKFVPKPFNYFIGSIMIGISSYYSYIELDKIIDLRSMINKYFKKNIY
jgi:O-antigen/teichoic acid export membrane protein